MTPTRDEILAAIDAMEDTAINCGNCSDDATRDAAHEARYAARTHLEALISGQAETGALAVLVDADVEAVARAILKARFYDCEPEMYDGLDDFWRRTWPDEEFDVMYEARAAVAAIADLTAAQAE